MTYVESKTSQFENVDNSVARFNTSHRNFKEMESFGSLFAMNIKKTSQKITRHQMATNAVSSFSGLHSRIRSAKLPIAVREVTERNNNYIS